MGWLVYERGEATVYDDVREAEVMQNPDTSMRSELLLPLGEHGLFVAGTTTAAAFGEGCISLGRVFADTVEAALDRAEREERLARKNDQLDRFASVVSHDLRSPLTVAQGRLDLARETGDDEQLDHVRTALERIDALLEDLLHLARDGRRVGSTEPVSFESAVRSARSDVPAPLAVTVERDGVVEADRGRLRELLSNLLANAADHGASSARLGWLETGNGFYVADDGPGVDPTERDRTFEHGYTTTESGSGFGLAIVREIAAGHGWDVSLGESAAGGLRVEVAVAATDP